MRYTKPVLGLAVALAVGVGALPSQAASSVKPKVRTVTITYTGGCGFDVNAEVVTTSGAPGTCPAGANYTLKHKAGEKYLSIIVKDGLNGAVSGNLWLSDGVPTAKNAPFCGSLKNYPMAQPSYSMDLNTAADPTCPGAATSGTIILKYSNVPLK